MNSQNRGITGLVLAGGQGRRMGSVDKGLVALNGKPLVRHVVERFEPQVDEILINANRNIEQYETLGWPVIRDRIEGFAGPLAGLHAGLSHARHALIATVPCDSPFIAPDLVARLVHDGGRKIDAWYASLATVEVAFDDEADAFRNINTAAELEEASGGD